MPRVTFPAANPAKWKVLRVIWVEGSPTDCAANTPTASPGSMRDRRYFNSIRTRNFLAVKSLDLFVNNPLSSDPALMNYG